MRSGSPPGRGRSLPCGWRPRDEAGHRFRPPPLPERAEEVAAELRRVRRRRQLTTELRPAEEVLQRGLQRPELRLREPRCPTALGELHQCLAEGKSLAPQWLEHPVASAHCRSTP